MCLVFSQWGLSNYLSALYFEVHNHYLLLILTFKSEDLITAIWLVQIFHFAICAAYKCVVCIVGGKMDSLPAICVLINQCWAQPCHRKKSSSFLQGANYVAKKIDLGLSLHKAQRVRNRRNYIKKISLPFHGLFLAH